MARKTSGMMRGAFAAAVAVALGFGATQAFAAETAKADAWCTPKSCTEECAPFAGFCKFSNGICYCAG